jgi:arylsulfatase A-like enzyme
MLSNKPSTRFGLLMLALTAMVACPAILRADEAPRRPNIVLIVADDLGYGELGCQGRTKEIPTPNIDSLAKNGTRFTSGYVSCPVCSPTRAGLMTGRYQQRFGHEFNPGGAEGAAENFGLPLTEATLPQRLKAAGYATGMVGKWHLGNRPEYLPLRRGFDEFFGFLGGAHSYVDARADGRNPILRGTEPVDEKLYLTDAFAREAVAFVDRHKAEPFFLYLAFNAVHNPLQAPQKYQDRFPSIEDPKRRTFAAMLSAQDDAVGAVLSRLREAGLEGNTLIFYISDNGGPTPQTTSKNDPLGGRKGQVFEGGIRVPFLVQWKGHLPAGKVDDRPVIALDIHPTALAAAGAPAPAGAKLDGVDLLPFLSGRSEGAPHDSLFWRFGAQSAVRQGDWKLVKQTGDPARLYDLSKDIGESRDLAAEEPSVVKALEGALAAWDAQLEQPRWKQNQVRRRRLDRE